LSNSSRFGKYLVVERIGLGGMAEVFKAKTFGAEGFERLLAIKRILPHLVEDTDFVSMFVDEAKIAVRLQHPNIVTIHDLGRAEGTLFIAMELVQGRDLRAVYDVEEQRGGRVPIPVAIHVVMKMCEALHHAHFATGPRGEPLQVIHRDVSPQNVMLSYDGEVKVADFGLAKARGRMVQTQAGVVKGKLAYMSPEQLSGDEIDHRVDVFGIGIVLFELLTGTRLFLASTDMDTLRRVYDCQVPPMRELNPAVHPDLEAIVRRALAKDRDARYGTALELHDDLQFFAYGNDCYGSASTLRAYLREIFPDAVPSMEDELPPFTSVPRPPVPGPTLRPPSRHRASSAAVHAPPPAPPAPPQPPSAWAPPPAPAPVSAPHGGMPSPAPVPPAAAYSTSAPVAQAYGYPPQSPAHAAPTASAPVLTQRVIHTGHPSGYPPPPGRSGVATALSLPDQPLGLYDDDVRTEKLPLEDASVDANASPTSPAPAPDGAMVEPFPDWTSPDGASPDGASPDGASPDGASPDWASPDWASPDRTSPDGAFPDWASPDCDDEPTLHSAPAPEASGTEPRPDAALWDDDATVVVVTRHKG
jgi:serine/threonine protein kinase